MLTVAAVCVPGGIYQEDHVNRLFRQVEEHLTIPYTTHVIRESDKPGWWSKIDLFQPGRFTDRVLYLDLDVTITGSLDDLVCIDAPFAAIKDYQYTMTINSSVMVWDAGVADHVYTEFTLLVMHKFHGDQGWINNRMPMAKRFPKEWCVSYKKDVAHTGVVPDGARIVVYHGKPKPWELK